MGSTANTDLAQLLINRQDKGTEKMVRAGRHWRYMEAFTSGGTGVHIKRYGLEHIMLSGAGTVSPSQCVGMGFYLIELAESIKQFDAPAPFRKRRLTGRCWTNQHGIKDLCMADYRGCIYSNGTIRLQPNKHGDGNIDVFFTGIATPARAREIGAYLCGIGQQQLDQNKKA